MGVTKFGEAIRKARHHTKLTLLSMATEIGVSVAYLSAIEVGRNKVPVGFVEKILAFFNEFGYQFDEDLHELAMLSNESVPLRGLTPLHQALVAGFANSSLSSKQLERLAKELKKIQMMDKVQEDK